MVGALESDLSGQREVAHYGRLLQALLGRDYRRHDRTPAFWLNVSAARLESKMTESHLVKILFTVVPIPSLSAKGGPFIKSRLATPDPGIVIKAATTSKNLASSIGFFYAFIVGPINQSCLVSPIVVAIA
jgi:hypothetical protein